MQHLSIGRKPVLPIEMELLGECVHNDDNCVNDIDKYCEELANLRKNLYERTSRTH